MLKYLLAPFLRPLIRLIVALLVVALVVPLPAQLLVWYTGVRPSVAAIVALNAGTLGLLAAVITCVLPPAPARMV